MFTHLHSHSYYSFLDGIPSPKKLVEHAVIDGMRSLALTDHHGLTGAIEFYEACQEGGIKPILGLEVTIRHPLGTGNLVVLGTNLIGWSNLCRLSSSAQGSLDRDPTIGVTIDTLAKYSSDLICLSGGKQGLASILQDSTAQLYLGQIADIFKNHFYIEVQSQEPADAKSIRRLVSISRWLDVPLVATNNVHYINPEHSRLQRTLSAIRLIASLKTLPSDAPAPSGSYFKSSQEMARQFEEIPSAITNTQEISDRCNLELPLGIPHYPEIPLPPGETSIGRLRKLAEKGAVRKYGEITQAIRERLSHELSVIHDRGYAPLFLIVQEILDYARESGVPISSRGSAASSLVAYCLGITTPDPLALNLYFERFLNPARSSPPDIDTDLCSRQRNRVIEHVYQRYGADRVAMVATINHFQRRSALREVAKAYGITRKEINQLTAALPSRGWGPPGSRRRSPSDDPYEDIKTRYRDAKFQALFRDASEIIGLPRHLSVHPGGIVITPDVMTNLVPTHLASKGILITQFDLKSIERLGLVKIDLLGSRGLTVLGDVAGKVRQWRSVEFSDRLSVLESIPDNEPKTTALLQSTKTIGCFAIESPGMRATLREIGAATPEDIMVALALYRPGPMTGGLKDSFVRRHLGKEPVQHIHPALASLLENTHGVILYQEQVLRIASELAGLSLADADLLRRAMSHFDPGDQMKTLKSRFINGALGKSGVSESVSEQIWQLMAAFAGYGFPKAHAASYAQVAWRSVWCKSHYPAEFMAAVLAGGGGYYRQHVYINEARHLNLVIRPPHINHSRQQFSAAYPNGHPILYMGLNQVRNLSRMTQKRIMERRPFHSLDDFLTRVDPSPKEAGILIRVGALDGLGKIPELISKVKAGGWRIGQPRLFDVDFSGGRGDDWDLNRRLTAQDELLGIPVEAHPVELIADLLAGMGTVTTHQALELEGSEVEVVGIRQTIQRFHTSQGETFQILELDDRVGVLPVRLSDKMYRQHRETISSRTPFYLAGSIVADPDSRFVYLDAQTIKRLDQN